MRASLTALLGLVAALALPGVAGAANESAVLHARAARLAVDAGCDEALPVIRRARGADARFAPAALLEGQCLFESQRYVEALEPLSAAYALDPVSGEAALYLGMARYHAGEPGVAREALERAEQQLPGRPEVALYRGLVLLESDPGAAAKELGRVADAGGALAPAAAYYVGVARFEAGDREAAEAALRRVGELAPGSVWARRAEEALAAPAAQRRLRRWAVLHAGVEYDSNVALRSDVVALPAGISGQDDGRAWWGVEAGHELWRRERWGGGALGRYYGSAHFTDGRYDEHLLAASLWVDRSVGEHSLLRFQPEFGQSFYGYDSYLRFYGALGEWLHDFGRAGQGRAYARYAYYDYRFSLSGPLPATPQYLDRDGHGLRAGYDHFFDLDANTTLRGGAFGRFFLAEGGEYDRNGLGGWAGVRRALPWELVLDVLGSVTYDYYRRPSAYLLSGEAVRDREDRISLAQVELSRPIHDRVTLTARYRYQDNHSNTSVFDYDRHVVGAYVTVAFGD